MGRGDARQFRLDDSRVGLAARQGVNRRTVAMIIGERLPLVGRIEDDPGVGMPFGGNAGRHAAVVGPRKGWIGVEIAQ